MTSLSRFFTRSYSAAIAATKSAVADTAAVAGKTAAVKKPAVKKKAVRKKAEKDSTEPRALQGIMKPMPISPALSEFIGAPESSRAEAVKKVWEHIKANNLQDPQNKKKIFCDDKLKTIFDGKAEVGFLEVARLLSHHFVKSG